MTPQGTLQPFPCRRLIREREVFERHPNFARAFKSVRTSTWVHALETQTQIVPLYDDVTADCKLFQKLPLGVQNMERADTHFPFFFKAETDVFKLGF